MTDEERDRVVEEAISWLNTPYHPHARVKGVGVDCALLLAEVYQRAGIIGHLEPGYYSPQFGLHRDQEAFIEFIVSQAGGTEVARPQRADAVLFQYGKVFSHGGIMVSETRFVHAVMRAGMVSYSDLDETEYANRPTKFFTIGS